MERVDSLIESLKVKISSSIDFMEIIESGLPFEDPQFPPDQSSLFNLVSHSELSDRAQEQWRILIWAKPEKIYKSGRYDLFAVINPDSIRQGHLGNCYFLSALSALAEYPMRVREVFLTPERNKSGVYAVRVFTQGTFSTIVIDDYIPVHPGYDFPYFSHTQNNDIWVPLVEKVWAKANGGYENTSAGTEEEALRFLTGAPCTRFHNKEERSSSIWGDILEAYRNQWIVCAASRPEQEEGITPGENIEDVVGLVSQHAYSLILAKEIRSVRGTERIILLRNPWGRFEWTGDWSKDSRLWTPQLKQELGFHRAKKGCFFMPFLDFLAYFDVVTICHHNSKYLNNSINVQEQSGERKYHLFQLIITEETDGFFSIYQLESRFMSSAFEGYSPSVANMIIGRYIPESQSYELVECRHSKEDHLCIHAMLKEGLYIILVELEWGSSIKEFVLNTYTSHKIITESISREQCPDFLNSVMKSCANTRTELVSYGDKGAGEIYRSASIDSGVCYGFFYYKNESREQKMALVLQINNAEYCRPMHPHVGQSKFEIILGAGEEYIVVYHFAHMHGQGGVKYSWHPPIIRQTNAQLMDRINSGMCEMKQLLEGNVYHDSNLFILKHEWGKVYHFSNQSGNYSLYGQFKFSVNNAVLDKEECMGEVLDIILQPGEVKTLYFETIYPFARSHINGALSHIHFTKVEGGGRVIPPQQHIQPGVPVGLPMHQGLGGVGGMEEDMYKYMHNMPTELEEILFCADLLPPNPPNPYPQPELIIPDIVPYPPPPIEEKPGIIIPPIIPGLPIAPPEEEKKENSMLPYLKGYKPVLLHDSPKIDKHGKAHEELIQLIISKGKYTQFNINQGTKVVEMESGYYEYEYQNIFNFYFVNLTDRILRVMVNLEMKNVTNTDGLDYWYIELKPGDTLHKYLFPLNDTLQSTYHLKTNYSYE